MQLRTLALAAPLALAAACGGAGSSTTVTTADFLAAAPTYAALSIDEAASDATPPAAIGTGAASADLVAAAVGTGISGAGCHPHLFLRQREVVERLNRHIYKVLRHVERVLADDPTGSTAATRTWDRVVAGVEARFTVTAQSDVVFDWLLEVGPAGGPLETAMTGTIDRTGATGPHQGSGTFHLDFGALHDAFPATHRVSGTLDVAFDTQAGSRLLSVQAHDVAWELDPARLGGDQATVDALSAPRSGDYVFYRAPGKGGSLKLQDQMVFACPANPSLLLSDARLVSRWYVTTDTLEVHGRSDALVTGGQLAGTAVDRIVATTCHAGSHDGAAETEGFWLMKAEAADGSTVSGVSSASLNDTSATACDPALGATVPDLVGSTSDFADWPGSYADGAPYPFPGM